MVYWKNPLMDGCAECGGRRCYHLLATHTHRLSLLLRLISSERRLMMCTLLYFHFNGRPPTPHRISCPLLGVILAPSINFLWGFRILKRRLVLPPCVPGERARRHPWGSLKGGSEERRVPGRQPARHGCSTNCIPLPLPRVCRMGNLSTQLTMLIVDRKIKHASVLDTMKSICWINLVSYFKLFSYLEVGWSKDCKAKKSCHRIHSETVWLYSSSKISSN